MMLQLVVLVMVVFIRLVKVQYPQPDRLKIVGRQAASLTGGEASVILKAIIFHIYHGVFTNLWHTTKNEKASTNGQRINEYGSASIRLFVHYSLTAAIYEGD